MYITSETSSDVKRRQTFKAEAEAEIDKLINLAVKS